MCRVIVPAIPGEKPFGRSWRRERYSKRLHFVLNIAGSFYAAAFVAVFRFLLRARSHYYATDINPLAANVPE